jgi:hypothetical protein
MEKLIFTTLLAILLLAPQAGLQAKGDQELPNGKPFSDLDTRIDELEKRILTLEESDPPGSSELVFSGDFTQGAGTDSGTKDAWFKFTGSAEGSFTAIEIKNNLSGSAICSDAGKSTDIANALNSFMVGGATETFECDSRFWNVGEWGSGVALSAGPTKAVNDCSADASVRPLVAHGNWGGIGLTCDAPDQTLEVILTR